MAVTRHRGPPSFLAPDLLVGMCVVVRQVDEVMEEEGEAGSEAMELSEGGAQLDMQACQPAGGEEQGPGSGLLAPPGQQQAPRRQRKKREGQQQQQQHKAVEGAAEDDAVLEGTMIPRSPLFFLGWLVGLGVVAGAVAGVRGLLQLCSTTSEHEAGGGGPGRLTVVRAATDPLRLQGGWTQ